MNVSIISSFLFVQVLILSVSFPQATHRIEHLDDPTRHGDHVVVHGYLGGRHDISGKLSFVDLISQDLKHKIQIVAMKVDKSQTAIEAFKFLRRQAAHTPVVIKGRLQARRPDPNLDTQLASIITSKATEIRLEDIQVLNEVPKQLFRESGQYPPEQRHLSIRTDRKIRDTLEFRAKVAQASRTLLAGRHNFLEIETPLLFKSTPEGAREFVVPTRTKGLAYSLPQSPQQFKQVLMASGIPRYFQLARCFRDEDLRADRQPEFTQLDLEMSFASGEDVMNVMTALIVALWKSMLGVSLPPVFPRMTYAEAMAGYGVDKPDVRYGKPLRRVDDILPADLISKITSLPNPAVDALHIPFGGIEPARTREFVHNFMDNLDSDVFNENPDGGPGIFIFDHTKPMNGLHALGFEAAGEVLGRYQFREGDLLILQARKDVPFSGGSLPIGNLRTALWREAVKVGLLQPAEGFQPLWVTDFPLFSPVSSTEPGQGGAAGLASTHHPFTSPKAVEDVDLLVQSPEKVIGEHYDLVMNGVELGGGSRRIHNAAIQRFIMEKVLQMSPDRVSEFNHLLEVLRAGCPPHAGIALGFDRLIAVMLGKTSLRDVIAFPKNGSGEDVLMKSPGTLSQTQLDTYHLELKK